MSRVDIQTLVGKTFAAVTRVGDEITFVSPSEQYRLCHMQDCCENVELEDVVGDLEDLVGTPITLAEERIGPGRPDAHESTTWSFYELHTIKGSVTLRWHGSSNGYYGEEARLYMFKPETKSWEW